MVQVDRKPRLPTRKQKVLSTCGAVEGLCRGFPQGLQSILDPCSGEDVARSRWRQVLV